MTERASTGKHPTERFFTKIRKTDGCWEWTACSTHPGDQRFSYGSFFVAGRMVRAHRFMWELLNGPIPDGLDVLHGCDNPSCVRPDHLHLGDAADNTREMHERGREKWFIRSGAGTAAILARTHCRNGHPYDKENTRVDGVRGHRHCRACRRAYLLKKGAA